MAAELPMSVLAPGGAEEDWLLRLDMNGEPRMALVGSGGTEWCAAGDDLFEVLAQIRLQIEPLGYLLLCNGARVDAYPSSMSLEMSKGRVLYVLRMGVSPRRTVDLFGRADPAMVGTVAEQSEFYRSWLSTPRRRRLIDQARDAVRELWVRWRDR